MRRRNLETALATANDNVVKRQRYYYQQGNASTSPSITGRMDSTFEHLTDDSEVDQYNETELRSKMTEPHGGKREGLIRRRRVPVDEDEMPQVKATLVCISSFP